MIIDSRTLTDIKASIDNLNDNKMTLGLEKQKLEVSQAVIRNKIRGRAGRIAPDEYKSLVRKQGENNQKILDINEKIISIKNELAKKQRLRDECEIHLLETSSEVSNKSNSLSKLQSLKSKYMSFASDMTRVSSMRVMASQIAEELDAIIKDLKKS
jgi:hypothetical protein